MNQRCVAGAKVIKGKTNLAVPDGHLTASDASSRPPFNVLDDQTDQRSGRQLFHGGQR